jgi:flagellar protein FliO/FliZ
MSPGARLVLLCCAAWPAWCSAADPVAPSRPFAAPSAAENLPAPAAGLTQVTLSLLLVLAAVFVTAWLVRRARGLQRTRTGAGLAVLGEVAVGPRERVVLVDVAGRQVLIGVAPGSVRALKCWPDAGGDPP